MRPRQNRLGNRRLRRRRASPSRASMRPRQNRLGNFLLPCCTSCYGLASMRPRQNRLGNGGIPACLPCGKASFNEAEAKPPRKCGGAVRHLVARHASMRPRQNRLGNAGLPDPVISAHRASMRPRQNRLGNVSSCRSPRYPAYSFNEAEAKPPRKWQNRFPFCRIIWLLQ